MGEGVPSTAPQATNAIAAMRLGNMTNKGANVQTPAPPAKPCKKPAKRADTRSTMTLRARRSNVSYAKFDESDGDNDYEESDGDGDGDESDAGHYVNGSTGRRKGVRTASVDTEPSDGDGDGDVRHECEDMTHDELPFDHHAHRGGLEQDDESAEAGSCSTEQDDGDDGCCGFSDSGELSGHDTPELEMEPLDLTVVGRACGILVHSLEEAYALNHHTPVSDALVDSFLA
jgi:hypothetical protein